MPIKVREGGAWVEVSSGGGGGGSSDPVGTIVAWADSTPPTGWLECNGQSTSGYTELAAVVGANVPDLRGEFVRGWDNGAGVDTDRTLGSTQGHQFEDHTHNAPVGTAAGGGQASLQGNFAAGAVPTSGAATGNSGTETRPRNIALMYIIKHTATSGGANGLDSKVLQTKYKESNLAVNIAQQNIVPIAGLAVQINPISTSSKILLEANIVSNNVYVSSFGFALGTTSVYTRLGGISPAGSTNTNSTNAISTIYNQALPLTAIDSLYSVTYRYLYTQDGTPSPLTFHACACSSWATQIYTLMVNNRPTLLDMSSTSSITATEIEV